MDGFALHFVHVVGEAEGQRPLLLSHGWPSAVFEFWSVIQPLAFPSRHGGRAEDAFDLVIPSLPGFGYSGKPKRLIDQRETAHLFDRLMAGVLGYGRYLAQGGDWGALVTAMLGLNHADHARAIQITMPPQPAEPPETAAERRWAEAMQAVEKKLGAYARLQASKPQSLAWAMEGNPVGQASWIVERFHDWGDLRERPFDAVFTRRDQLLTNAMLYLMPDAFTTSVWYYAAALEGKTRKLQRVGVPTAFTSYPDPRHPRPPRSLVEKGYNVTRWTEMPRGGHFPAMEVPDLWVEDVRAWGRETG